MINKTAEKQISLKNGFAKKMIKVLSGQNLPVSALQTR